MTLDPAVADYLARVAADIPPLAEKTQDSRGRPKAVVKRPFPAPVNLGGRRRRWKGLAGRGVGVRL